MFMTTNFFIMLAIVVYLAIMLVIGFVYSKRNNSTEDFYLGGRKMGPLVTAMSAEASDMSSWLLALHICPVSVMPHGLPSVLPLVHG